MRAFLIAVLLAGVAAHALARPDIEDRGERGSERSERAERAERPQRSEARESAPRQERSVERPQQRSFERRVESSGGSGGESRAAFGGRSRSLDSPDVQAVERVHGRDRADTVRQLPQRRQVVETSGDSPRRNFEPKLVRAPRHAPEVIADEGSGGDSVRNWRSRERLSGDSPTGIEAHVRRAPIDGAGDLVQSKRPLPRVFERAERRVSRTPVFGTEPPAPRTSTAIAAKPARHWRTDWRHDRRYNWRDWRRRHRSHFHFGFYYDPFGWDYFRYGIGWRLWPSYYRSSFWLNDPWYYRLPPAYGPYRWIRYFNDALLVNIYTGQVVDVEYNVFW